MSNHSDVAFINIKRSYIKPTQPSEVKPKKMKLGSGEMQNWSQITYEITNIQTDPDQATAFMDRWQNPRDVVKFAPKIKEMDFRASSFVLWIQ